MLSAEQQEHQHHESHFTQTEWVRAETTGIFELDQVYLGAPDHLDFYPVFIKKKVTYKKVSNLSACSALPIKSFDFYLFEDFSSHSLLCVIPLCEHLMQPKQEVAPMTREPPGVIAPSAQKSTPTQKETSSSIGRQGCTLVFHFSALATIGDPLIATKICKKCIGLAGQPVVMWKVCFCSWHSKPDFLGQFLGR